jgi:hypothetical protein
MAWEKIDEKLKNALSVKIAFPAGTIWLPDHHLTIDEWLTSVAETDEELQELNIPRIRFLQNRWRMDRLVELEWDDEFTNKRVILAMYVGQRAYILFSDWSNYDVIAAVEPKDRPSLYRALIGKLLENPGFVAKPPTHVENRRPDLVPDFVFSVQSRDTEDVGGPGRPIDRMHAGSKFARWSAFLSDVLVGWIGKWLNLPELGFWHEDMPESITKTKEGEIRMKYKQSYGDKQREAQRRKKEEQPQSAIPPTAAKTNEPKAPEDSTKKKDKPAA